MVTIQAAFQIALAISAFLGGWFMKLLFDRIKKLEEADAALQESFGHMRETMMEKLSAMREELPKNYTSKADFKEMGDNIFSALRELGADTKASLQRIEDKLDNKADKQ